MILEVEKIVKHLGRKKVLHEVSFGVKK